jgi:hypothetical protein
MRKIRDRREERDHRNTQLIRNADRRFQRRIIERPLRALHPVDDTLAVFERTTPTPHQHARIIGDFLQGGG